MDRLIVKTIEQTGCTLVSDDRWSNTQHRPLINVMLFNPHGECFLKAVDSSGKIKSGAYIAKIISETIQKIGASNVVQVIMDNAKNCRATGRILEKKFQVLHTFGCNTHSLNLVLQDWYKKDDCAWFKSIVDSARKLVKFILKRQHVLDVYR